MGTHKQPPNVSNGPRIWTEFKQNPFVTPKAARKPNASNTQPRSARHPVYALGRLGGVKHYLKVVQSVPHIKYKATKGLQSMKKADQIRCDRLPSWTSKKQPQAIRREKIPAPGDGGPSFSHDDGRLGQSGRPSSRPLPTKLGYD